MESNSTYKQATNISKHYDLHLVPCKIYYTGPNCEFTKQFIIDQDKKVGQDDNFTSYIRGRKIIGKELVLSDLNYFLVDEVIEESRSHLMLNPLAKIDKIVNYERNGNEARLDIEMEKFYEFLELNKCIHG